MRTKSIDQLLEHCLRDADFRRQLLRDPAQTLKDNGYPDDEDLVQAIRHADPSTLEGIAHQIEQGSIGPTAGST
jgi:hypothetical protein